MPLDYYFKKFFLKLGQCEEWGFAFVLSPSICVALIWKVEFVLFEKRNVVEDFMALTYVDEGIIDWPMVKEYLKLKWKIKRGKQNENS